MGVVDRGFSVEHYCHLVYLLSTCLWACRGWAVRNTIFLVLCHFPYLLDWKLMEGNISYDSINCANKITKTVSVLLNNLPQHITTSKMHLSCQVQLHIIYLRMEVCTCITVKLFCSLKFEKNWQFQIHREVSLRTCPLIWKSSSRVSLQHWHSRISQKKPVCLTENNFLVRAKPHYVTTTSVFSLLLHKMLSVLKPLTCSCGLPESSPLTFTRQSFLRWVQHADFRLLPSPGQWAFLPCQTANE